MESDDSPARRADRILPISMERLRNQFGRLVRDENFWNLLDSLAPEDHPLHAPENVEILPNDRLRDATPGPGRVIAGRFPKR